MIAFKNLMIIPRNLSCTMVHSAGGTFHLVAIWSLFHRYPLYNTSRRMEKLLWYSRPLPIFPSGDIINFSIISMVPCNMNAKEPTQCHGSDLGTWTKYSLSSPSILIVNLLFLPSKIGLSLRYLDHFPFARARTKSGRIKQKYFSVIMDNAIIYWTRNLFTKMNKQNKEKHSLG